MPDSTTGAGAPAARKSASRVDLFSAAAAKSPLRILHVLAPARTGGLESVVIQLASGMRRIGHDVQVALVLVPGTDVDAHPVVQSFRALGVPLHILVLGTRQYLAERRAVRALLRKLNTQVLHTHGYRPDVILGGVARRLGVAHVMTLHGFVGSSWRGRLYEWLQVRAGRNASAVIVVSEPIRQRLEANGIKRNVHLVRNAVAPVADALGREEARAILGLPQDAALVGWVGRVSGEKGPEVFVETLGGLVATEHKAQRPVHGVIVGDGPMLVACKELARQLEVGVAGEGAGGRLHCLGLVPGASKYLAAFDILALTSRTEGTPMVLLEAMWARLPIAATAVGGVPDILSSNEAVLVESGDSAALSEGISGLLSDSAQARAMAERAYERVVKEQSPEVWLKRHSEIYEGCLVAE